MRLKEKNIIITGALGGIGQAATELCLDEGANLILSDLEYKSEDEFSFSNAKYFQADISSQHDVNNLFEFAKDRFAKLHGLLHLAGIESSADTLSCNPAHFTKVIQVNLLGAFLCLQAAANSMIENGGSIVLTSSQRGLLGSTGSIAYNASKGGVVIMGKSAALELGHYNIRVNVLCPGATDTPMLRRDLANFSNPLQRENEMLSKYPLGRFAHPEEIANGAIFLLSDEATFVTGTTLVIDGGNTAG